MQQLNRQIESTGLTKTELSRRLGKSINYIAEMQRIGCSTTKQAELIAKIEYIKQGGVYLSAEDQVVELRSTINNLTVKLAEANHWKEHNHNCAQRYLGQIHELEDKYQNMSSSLIGLFEQYDARVATIKQLKARTQSYNAIWASFCIWLMIALVMK